LRKIILFNDAESKVVKQLKGILRKMSKNEQLYKIANNETALQELAKSISWYPSVLQEQELAGDKRNIMTLVQNLCFIDVKDMIFNLPTKAILGQGYSIAKVNFFYMLLYIIKEDGDIEDKDYLRFTILEIIKNNIFSIMSEEVFIAIVTDRNISMEIRSSAGFLLANIWEYRIYSGVKEFAPILLDVWRIKDNFDPSYGTMLGVSELFSIFFQADQAWLDFLQKDDLSQNEIDSLQEFLFGLSFEDLKKLSDKMIVLNKRILTKSDVAEILGENSSKLNNKSNDPRDFFRSFSYRKNTAIYRKRGNIEGPKRTLEESLMCFLLNRPENWANF
jgi:hypothetical protein